MRRDFQHGGTETRRGMSGSDTLSPYTNIQEENRMIASRTYLSVPPCLRVEILSGGWEV